MTSISCIKKVYPTSLFLTNTGYFICFAEFCNLPQLTLCKMPKLAILQQCTCACAHMCACARTHAHFTTLWTLSRITLVSQYQNQSGFYWSKRQWVAVASAGLSANLHSPQIDNHASTLTLSFYRLDALSAAQPTASKHWRQKSITSNMY